MGEWVVHLRQRRASLRGVGVGFAEGLVVGGPPQHLAEQVLSRCFKGTNDALVLVVKYLGTGCE